MQWGAPHCLRIAAVGQISSTIMYWLSAQHLTPLSNTAVTAPDSDQYQQADRHQAGDTQGQRYAPLSGARVR